MPGNSNYSYVFHNFPVNPNGINYIELATFFYPDKDPKLPGFSRLCERRISAVPPDTITNITVTNFVHSGQNLASFTISWSPPVWINGHNISYYLWVGENELKQIGKLPGEDGQNRLNGDILYKKNIQVRNQSTIYAVNKAITNVMMTITIIIIVCYNL